jgi:hypothetical protein
LRPTPGNKLLRVFAQRRPDLIFQRFNLRLKKAENVRGFRLVRALADCANLARERRPG